MPKKVRPSSASASSSTILPQTLSDGAPLPSLVAFDLDYTLWPFWVDTHVTPPLKATGELNHVRDRYGDSWHFYDHVPGILHGLRQKGVTIAAASRTCAPELAREMLSLLKLDTSSLPGGNANVRGIDFFDEMEIYPGSKTTHFRSLQKKKGIDYKDMLFFDDETRNRNVERELGVLMILVPDGTNNEVFDRGVREWRKRNAHTRAVFGVEAGAERDG